MITVECVCPFCGTVTLVDVPAEGFFQMEDGALVQDAFPTLSAEKRELLISGMCPKCQQEIFGVDEDEDF